MKTLPILAAAIAVLSSGCLSPETIRKIEGTPGQEGTGIMGSRLPAVIKILATYEASAEQKAVAEERAHAAQAKLKGKKKPRYIAVDTDRDNRAQGAASVMLWDTQTEEIVGNNVYDVEAPPKLGEVAMWDTLSAQYVGVGRAGE